MAGSYDFSCKGTGTDGTIIRAGKNPFMGDITVNEPMDAYERVANILRPIRTMYPAVVWPQRPTGFDLNDAADWMKRFDSQ